MCRNKVSLFAIFYLSVFLSNLKSFEVVNALVTLTFVLTGEDRVGRIRGRKGYERQERKEWEV